MQKKGAMGGAGLEDHPFVFVVETCQNCKEHHWNTRHDEAKYLDFFNRGTYSPWITFQMESIPAK